MIQVVRVALYLVISLSAAVASTTTKPDWQYSFENMCERVPAECAPFGKTDRQVVLTLEKKLQLAVVNVAVNHEYAYQHDSDHYHIDDYWTYPQDGKADCEDFALEKRRRLVEKFGWPRAALSIAIVYPKGNSGKDELHAVLVARTDRGLLVLDSKNVNDQPLDAVSGLDPARMRVLSLQSDQNPARWSHSIDWGPGWRKRATHL
jgi:predicted transglutaminase-like cysteine proteinase